LTCSASSSHLLQYNINFQSSAFPRGRGLGGSGQMNYMMHNVGSKEDYVRWEASGATGWGLIQLQPYVSKMLGTEYKCINQKPRCLRSYQNVLMSAAGLSAHHNCVQVKVLYSSSTLTLKLSD
jgi:choline dehydrogenase-like flavoprotein